MRLIFRNILKYSRYIQFREKRCVRDFSKRLGSQHIAPLDDSTLTGRILHYLNIYKEKSRDSKLAAQKLLQSLQEGIVNNLHLYTNDDIINAYILFEQNQSVNDDDKISALKMLRELDVECCLRVTELEPNDIFKILSINLKIIPHRIVRLKFYQLSINNLCEAAEKLSKDDLIQLIFYIGLQKKMKEAQAQIKRCMKYLNQQHIYNLTREDICIVCNSTFKSSTKITNKLFLDRVKSYLNDNLNLLKDPALFITLIKTLRHNRYQDDNLLSTISCTIFFNRTLHYYSFPMICHLLALYSDYLYYDDNLLDVFIKKCLNELKDFDFKFLNNNLPSTPRMKDIKRLLWAASNLNYNGISNSDIKDVIIPQIISRIYLGEVGVEPESLMEIILYLWMMNYHAYELVPYALKPQHIRAIKVMTSRGKLLVALATAGGPVENKEKKIKDTENEGREDANYTYNSVTTCDSTSAFSDDHLEQSSSSDFVPDTTSGDSGTSEYSITGNCRLSKKLLSGLLETVTREQNSPEPIDVEVSSSQIETLEEGRSISNICPVDDETESLSSSDSTTIKIRQSKKNKLSGRRKDKRHCCYICQKIVCNLPRHFEKIHRDDVEINKIIALPKGSKRRRREYGKLQRVGDFYHNCEVLRLKKGELILLRVPTPYERKKYTYADYGPCPDCLGFLLKKNINVHVKQNKCLEHKTTASRNSLSECNSLLNGIYTPSLNENFITNIVNKFIADDVSQMCKEDDLILKFGNMMFEKYDVIQSEFIRQSMRQLGRLVIQIRNCDRKIASLSQCLTPVNFDKIVDATKMLCSVILSSSSRPEFKTPSLGLKIGYHIKKCVGIARGEALRQGNLKRNKELLSFLSIMDLEWNIKISSNALNTLHKRKFNSSQLLPLTADLIKLNRYLQTEMTKRREELKKKPSSVSYIQFASVILCRLVLFNKRRSGEAAKMTIKQYMMRPLWSEQTTEELKKSLSKFENALAESMVIVDVEGKRGRKVPVILTPELKFGMDLLLNLRSTCGINSQNPFIFARSQDSVSHLRGHDCIKKFVKDADLEQPENINATKLRKYIATVCQIFNLTENETNWLARHLGHDIRVHRDFYRLHESAIELTKISRLLLAVDKGEAKIFAGKNLEDIEISESKSLGVKRLNLLLSCIYFEDREYFKSLNLRAEKIPHNNPDIQLKKRPTLKRIYDNLKYVTSKTELNRFEINYQVPYLNIVGITGYKNNIHKTVHIEVLDDFTCVKNKDCYPSGLMELKLRILDRMDEAVITVPEDEVNDLSEFGMVEYLMDELDLVC